MLCPVKNARLLTRPGIHLAPVSVHPRGSLGAFSGDHTGPTTVLYNCPYRARELTGNSRLGDPRNNANDRHVNYYKRKRHLNAMDIGEGLEAVGELPELLAPLTDLDFGDIKS